MSRSAPKTLVSGLLLDEVILELSDNYLGGQDILFSDAREALNREIADMWTLAEVSAPLASWLNVEPVTAELVVPDDPRIAVRAEKLADYSRAKAWMDRNNRQEFLNALLRFCPELAHS